MKSRGCTIVEILIAIMLLAVGLLSMAGSSAIILKRLYAARANNTAAYAVSSRMSVVGSSLCLGSSGGLQQHTAGVSESWTVEPAGSGAVLARVQLTFAPHDSTRTFESVLACR